MHKVVAIILPLVLAWTVGALGEEKELPGVLVVTNARLSVIDDTDISGMVVVNRDVLLGMIRDAEQAGGALSVHTIPPIQRDAEGRVKWSPCYNRLHEALERAIPFVEYEGIRIVPLATTSEDEWKKAKVILSKAKDTLKECAP